MLPVRGLAFVALTDHQAVAPLAEQFRYVFRFRARADR